MSSAITLSPISPIYAEVTVPGSKSLTNRALIIAAMTRGTSVLNGALISEDTEIMMTALKELGVGIQSFPNQQAIEQPDEIPVLRSAEVARQLPGQPGVRPEPETCYSQSRTLVIRGPGGKFPNKKAELYVGNSGTSARFLTAALAFSDGVYRLYGKPRMHERPMSDLFQALRALGAGIQAENQNESLPAVITGNPGLTGNVTVPANVSSQFLSALLMAAVQAERPVSLNIAEGTIVSIPYINMTLGMMEQFGVAGVDEGETRRFSHFETKRYIPRKIRIEPDASAASYFFAIPAICGGTITVVGLSRNAVQGDVRFVDCLKKMGCQVQYQSDRITVSRPLPENGHAVPLHGIEVDMNEISDTVPTLAVVAMFADTPTWIRNVAHIRKKETDRIAAVVTELRKFGVRVDEFDDGLRIEPLTAQHIPSPVTVETYDDHRMAMSFARAGLKLDGVTILDPDCVQKTYPDFFSDLKKKTHTIIQEQKR